MSFYSCLFRAATVGALCILAFGYYLKRGAGLFAFSGRAANGQLLFHAGQSLLSLTF
jgi:hypothetical protein